jgi:hypothetical protein
MGNAHRNRTMGNAHRTRAQGVAHRTRAQGVAHRTRAQGVAHGTRAQGNAHGTRARWATPIAPARRATPIAPAPFSDGQRPSHIYALLQTQSHHRNIICSGFVTSISQSYRTPFIIRKSSREQRNKITEATMAI